MRTARSEIEAELLHWMRDEPEREDEERFGRLALDLFRHQFEHCAPYRRFCEGRGARPGTVGHWSEIPPVPTAAFKEMPLRSFPPEATRHVFRTSGTSGEGRGALYLDSLVLYEASLVPSFERGVLPDLGAEAPVRFLVLAAAPEEMPDSSLSHMFGVMVRRRGDDGSRFFLCQGRLDLVPLFDALARAEDAGVCTALCGTAFAFVHLLEAMDTAAGGSVRFRLPSTARILETGGFKGRARERSREALYGELLEKLGVPERRIVNQYGMTELGSQFYDSVLCDPAGPRRKLAPPWTRVRIVDPESGAPCPPGQVGAIRIVDLANTGSILALQTADLGCAGEGGFQVLGRAEGAEARGCSIAADEMLGGS